MGSVFSHHRTNADRSARDRSRHKEKIEKALKDGIHDIVADESIIGQDGKKKIRIPVKGIKEYKFVYGSNGQQQAGSGGDADISKGQKIGKSQKKKGKGDPNKPGDKAGEEYYDVEVTLEELAEYLFKDLELPDLEQKQMAEIMMDKLKKSGYRPQGIRPRLSKKESAKQRIKRKMAARKQGAIKVNPETGEEEFSFIEQDLRYKHYKQKPKPSSNACIFFIMDVSGSMTTDKKYLARSFFFLLYHFIRSQYEKTEIVFVAHDTQPYEVDEDKFFGRGTGGGTMVSPTIEYVIEQAEKRYNPRSWNLYAFHCSDGDNWGSDMQKTIEKNSVLKDMVQFYGYCEITPLDSIRWAGATPLSEAYEPYTDAKFKVGHIHEKTDVWKTFKKFFGKQLDLSK
jgi:sporulation protein YhbH